MKVAYIVGGLPFGGIERWLYDLNMEYKKTGDVQGRIFNLSGTGNLMPTYLEAGIDVVCIANSIRAIASHRLDTAFALRKKLKEFAPDIIHTVHFTGNHLGRIASLGLGIPVITHLRNIKREKNLNRRFSDKALSYATTKYLAVSKAVAEVVQSDHNLAGRPVQVLYNALNPERLDFPPMDLSATYGVQSPVILAVGRYVPQKNLDLLIRAIRILHDKGHAASLVLVGEGSERQRLEALRDELGLSDFVVLTGFRQDVPAFYRSSDVFAMPSDFEGFPIAQLEAMYCGLPCVVSRHVPSLEIASEASLVCHRTPEDIAEKCQSILKNKELATKLSSAAQAIASPMTMSNYAKKMIEIYQEL